MFRILIMITYKELQQILQPIQDQNQSQQESDHNKNPQKKGNGASKYSLTISHREMRKIPPTIPFNEYQIQRLDMSFNYLKELKSFKDQSSAHLNYLNVSFNFLTSIEKLGHLFPNLKVIDANANRIVSVELNDSQFPVLQALYLKNNKIQYFLHCPNSIQILCLDHNELNKLAFTGGQSLQVLSASVNKIEQFEIEQCESLNFIDLQQNMIGNMQKVKVVLKKCKELLSLNLIGNYVSKIAHKKYLIDVLSTCPALVKVDEVIINPHVRQAFKIMATQDEMELQMKQTEDKYRNRMLEQLKLKEEMIENLKNEQKKLEDQFALFMKKQKQQLDALQNYAKNNMGKKKIGIVAQNKQFKNLSNNYKSQAPDPFTENSKSKIKQDSSNTKALSNLFSLMNKDQGSNNDQSNNIAQQLTNYLVEGIIINKHKDEYKQFQKNQQEERVSKQSKIKKYLGIPEKEKNSKTQKSLEEEAQENEDSFTILSNDEEDQLSFEEKERRKKNMRNPGLVYRNSNQLIGASPIDIDEDIKSEDETIFNKKCLPYLVKNYGFHTVV